MAFSAATVWDAPQLKWPTLLFDWESDSADPLRVYMAGDRVEVKGTIRKPTNATRAESFIATLPESVNPGRAVNPGFQTRILQRSNVNNCTFKIADGQLQIEGHRRNQAVSEAHVQLSYHLRGF